MRHPDCQHIGKRKEQSFSVNEEKSHVTYIPLDELEIDGHALQMVKIQTCDGTCRDFLCTVL